MNLSIKLQNQLSKIDSKLVLSKTMDGTYHETYAFCSPSPINHRYFRAYPLKGNTSFIISLLENNKVPYTEFCTYKCIVSSIEDLALIVNTWVLLKGEIKEIKTEFIEIEKFKPYPIRNPNSEIESNWLSIKNRLFERQNFKDKNEWVKRYEELLYEIKKRNYFKSLFPYTSHQVLRFSRQKSAWDGWAFDLELHILPTKDKTKGLFYVNTPKESKKYYFENLLRAVDFYIEKVKEYKLKP